MYDALIEKDVPISPHGEGAARVRWGQMRAGDSALVLGKDHGFFARISSAMCQARKRHGGTWVSRRQEGGVRVWKTADEVRK